MNDRLRLLTRLTRRFGFNSRGLKSISSVSSSAYVRRSRGEFDLIKQRFVINPALIGLQSSLYVGGSRRTQDFAQNPLIPSRFNKEFLIHKKNIDIDKGFLHEKCNRSIR